MDGRRFVHSNKDIHRQFTEEEKKSSSSPNPHIESSEISVHETLYIRIYLSTDQEEIDVHQNTTASIAFQLEDNHIQIVSRNITCGENRTHQTTSNHIMPTTPPHKQHEKQQQAFVVLFIFLNEQRVCIAHLHG